MFHAGVKKQDSDIVTNGGRVMGLTVCDKDITDCINKAYKMVSFVDFEEANSASKQIHQIAEIYSTEKEQRAAELKEVIYRNEIAGHKETLEVLNREYDLLLSAGSSSS